MKEQRRQYGFSHQCYLFLKMKKSSSSLLSKTLMQFAVCTATCFILMAPIFYLLTKYYYAEDMVEVVEAVKQGQDIPPIDLEDDIITGMMIQFLLIFVVITFAMFVTMRFATKKLWQPFDNTLQKAEHFNLAQNEVPQFDQTDIEEFSRLNNSLEQLMKKDKETYRIQKEFTENASHELQTPIAIIRTKLDLLMQEHLGEKEMKIVSEIYELTIRMGHLNRNLLLLAKIENNQYPNLQDIDIVHELSVTLPLYEAIQNSTTISLQDMRTDKNIMIKANPILLECLLKNLIVNAIRNTKNKGEIKILISDNRLVVSNSAINEKPLDTNTIFRRFRSGGSQQQGNGLGLAIVKAICDYHLWTVDYHYEFGAHHFIVSF